MDDLKFQITTLFNRLGADDAKKVLGDLELQVRSGSGAAKEHGEKTKEAADALHQFGSRGGAAREVIEGLERAQNGGIRGFLGIAKAAAAAREGIGLAGWAVGVGAAIGLGTAIIELAHKFTEEGKAAEEAQKKTLAALGEQKSGADRLNETRLDQFKRELDGIGERASAAERALKNFYDTVAKTAKLEKELKIARVNADASLTPEQKKKEIEAIEEDDRQLAESRGDRQEDKELKIKDKAAKDARELATKAAEDARHQREIEKQIREDTEARAKEEKDIKARLLANSLALANSDAYNPELSEEQAKLQRRLEYLQSRDAAINSEGGQNNLKAAGKRASDAEADAKQAEEKARQAEREAAEAHQLKETRDSERDYQRELERRRRNVEQGLPETAPARTPPAGPGKITIGGKDYGEIIRHVDGAIKIGEGDAAIERLGSAASRLADSMERKIEIDGRKFNEVTKRLDQVEAQVRASNRGN